MLKNNGIYKEFANNLLFAKTFAFYEKSP